MVLADISSLPRFCAILREKPLLLEIFFHHAAFRTDAETKAGLFFLPGSPISPGLRLASAFRGGHAATGCLARGVQGSPEHCRRSVQPPEVAKELLTRNIDTQNGTEDSMRKERNTAGQYGFTLIEIIAVLVILGILASFAIPKYQDLQVQAARKAAEGGVAAAQSWLSMEFARTLLDTTVTFDPTACATHVEGGTHITVTCSGLDSTNSSNITATYKKTTTDTGEQATGKWTRP